jgi:large subunit ribosomal protein L31
MKEKIHPQYIDCKVTCGCGNTFMTRSAKAELHVEICSNCHPFYTGKQKFVDTAGRVEKFQKRHTWDNSTVGKVMEKEPTKKNPKRLEKVTIGLPKARKGRPVEGEEEDGGASKAGAGPAKGGARGKGGAGTKGKTDGKAEAAPAAAEAPAAAGAASKKS